MLDGVVADLNVILTFAGIATLLTAGYRRWVSQTSRLRHHHALLGAFDWIVRAG